MNSIGDMATFVREFRSTFQTTGSILPSSRSLARAITKPARAVERPARWLEVGPGTGAFTASLVRDLGPADELVLVELNDRFVATLRRRLENDPVWSARRAQVRLIHDSIEALDATERFHAVVCGLPFNNFDPALVESLVSKMLSHLQPGGTFSFFEYLAIRSLKAPFVGPHERQRLGRVAEVLGRHLAKHGFAHDRVFANVPPAVAHHLRVSTAKPAAE